MASAAAAPVASLASARRGSADELKLPETPPAKDAHLAHQWHENDRIEVLESAAEFATMEV